MAECKSCKAQIIWAETDKGKKIPLDVKAEKRFIIKGCVALIVDTYTSHFATCPDADKFRKPKDSQ